MGKGRKILVLATTFPRWKNDTEPSFVHDLSLLLRKKGHDITVLVPHHPGAKKSESMDGLKIVRFNYFWPASSQRLCYDGGILPNLKKSFLAKIQLPFLVLSEYFAVMKLLRKSKFDGIHAHWAVPQGYIASIAMRCKGTPYVVTVHAGDVFPLRNSFLRYFGRLAISKSSYCTANSLYTKSKITALWSSQAKRHQLEAKLDVIPMGVDLSLFTGSKQARQKARGKLARKIAAHSSAGIQTDDKIILAVGRLAGKKGFEYLVKAMPKIIGKQKHAKLVFVGDGPEKQHLENLAAELKVESSIVFIGKLPNKELPIFYNAADVFVLPSIIMPSGDTEGLGVVLLEALASGTPVVASNVGGIPDIVMHNKTGLLVDQKNPSQLASAITRILSNPKLGEKLVKAGQQRVREKFSWNVVAEKFDAIFRRLPLR